MAKSIHWDQLEFEYITKKTSYRKLAEKHKVSRGAVEKYAREHKWTKQRSQYWGNIKANALARTGAHEVERLVILQQEADAMAEVLEKVIKDKKQFQRHVATGVDVMGNVNIVEAIVDKYDMKAIKNYTAALRELSGVVRDLYEIYPEPVRQKMKIDNEKLKLDKEKVKILREDKLPQTNDDEYGVIEIAEVMEPQQEESKEEGEEDAEGMVTST